MWSRRQFLCGGTAVSLALASGSWGRSAVEDSKAPGKGGSKLITPETRQAIEAGLKFLADHQNADGSFGTQAWQGNVGVTSLAALALVAGAPPPRAGARGKVVTQALDFVLAQENRSGRHPGYLHNPAAAPHGPMYSHGYGTLLLAHLHGQVKERKRDRKLREVLGRAVQLTVASQNSEGGWRYTPDSRDADISVTACQMLALAAASQAGQEVPRRTIDRGVEYVKACQDKREGWFRYQKQGGGGALQGFARTAAGLAVLQAAGVGQGAEIEKGLTYLLGNRPDPKAPLPYMHFFYGHYYAAQALHMVGGDVWERWYKGVREELRKRQQRDGSWRDLIDPHYATAMACLILLAPDAQVGPRFGPRGKG